MDWSTKDSYCGFTENAINITGKSFLPIFSNGLSRSQCHFFLTEGQGRNTLGNDNLPKVGIELSQMHFPHYLNKRTCKSINLICPTDKEKEKDIISITFKQFFLRSRKNKNQTKIVHFHEPLRPIQLKVRFVSLHLFETVKAESNRLKSERLIKKLENFEEDRFISPIVIICKKNKYQTPNIHELVDKVASQISNDSIGESWFTNLDLKNAYSQLSLDNFTSSQCNLSLIGGDTTGTYQFLTGS